MISHRCVNVNVHVITNSVSLLLQIFSGVIFTSQRSPFARQHVRSVVSSSLNLLCTFRDLFYRADSLASKSFNMRTEQPTKFSEPLRKLRATFGTR